MFAITLGILKHFYMLTSTVIVTIITITATIIMVTSINAVIVFHARPHPEGGGSQITPVFRRFEKRMCRHIYVVTAERRLVLHVLLVSFRIRATLPVLGAGGFSLGVTCCERDCRQKSCRCVRTHSCAEAFVLPTLCSTVQALLCCPAGLQGSTNEMVGRKKIQYLLGILPGGFIL